jgi:hypothetical protein
LIIRKVYSGYIDTPSVMESVVFTQQLKTETFLLAVIRRMIIHGRRDHISVERAGQTRGPSSRIIYASHHRKPIPSRAFSAQAPRMKDDKKEAKTKKRCRGSVPTDA